MSGKFKADWPFDFCVIKVSNGWGRETVNASPPQSKNMIFGNRVSVFANNQLHSFSACGVTLVTESGHKAQR